VVLEATYGWYWAVDALRRAGAGVHLAHPLGVKAFEYRRVKNDVRDATDLADLLRMGRLPEAWIAPPATRELRELVRHRAKLVALRSHCKAEVHAVLAKCGVQVLMSDLFGIEGNTLLDRLRVPAPYAARIASLRRLLEDLDFEIDLFTNLVRGRLRADPGYAALQQIPGIGPVLAAVFVAEVGDVARFASAPQLACWAGLTRSITSPTPTCTVVGSPSRAPGWCAGQRWSRSNASAPVPASAPCGTGSRTAAAPTSARRPRPGCRWSTSSTRCATATSARLSIHPGSRHDRRPTVSGRSRGRAGHDPRPRRGRAV
jgi:hypothetical protein